MSIQPSLFEFEVKGTKIKQFKKYIGLEIELFDVLVGYWKKHKKGIVTLIEKITIDGNSQYRIELDNGSAVLVKEIDNVIKIFEENNIFDPKGIDRLFRDKQICFVSFNELQEWKNYQLLRNFTDADFASAVPESVFQHPDRELYSFDNIIVDGRRATKISIVEDDFYSHVKEKDSSKIYHINMNYELTTLCGKKLEVLIDMQEFSHLNRVCRKCQRVYDEL